MTPQSRAFARSSARQDNLRDTSARDEQIRRARFAGMTVEQIAHRYGVWKTTVEKLGRASC